MDETLAFVRKPYDFISEGCERRAGRFEPAVECALSIIARHPRSRGVLAEVRWLG